MKISMSLQMSNLEIDGEKYKIEKTGEKRAASSNYIVHTREGDTNSNHREKQVYVSDLPKEVVIPDPVIKTQNHPQTPRAHTPRPGRILYILAEAGLTEHRTGRIGKLQLAPHLPSQLYLAPALS